jgi:hypothetical protein
MRIPSAAPYKLRPVKATPRSLPFNRKRSVPSLPPINPLPTKEDEEEEEEEEEEPILFLEGVLRGALPSFTASFISKAVRAARAPPPSSPLRILRIPASTVISTPTVSPTVKRTPPEYARTLLPPWYK